MDEDERNAPALLGAWQDEAVSPGGRFALEEAAMMVLPLFGQPGPLLTRGASMRSEGAPLATVCCGL